MTARLISPAHRRHPLSRFERFLALLCAVALSFFFAAILEDTEDEHIEGTTLTRTERYVASLFLGLINTAIQSFFAFMAVLDDRLFSDVEGGFVKRCCGRIGRCINLACLFILIPFAIAALLIASDERGQNTEEVMAIYSLSFLHSWTYIWIAVAVVRFLWTARKDRQLDEKRAAQGEQLHLSYQELLAWEADETALDDDSKEGSASQAQEHELELPGDP